MTNLERKVLAWWRSHRPVEWGAEDHRQNPIVNVVGGVEAGRLARHAAELSKQAENDG